MDVSPKDVVLNALPVFHSFGLTGGLLLPLLAGVRTFLYPSPLHYRTVPELAYGIDATILFGTDTFLAGYARVADSYDFYSVRYVFAGAERVKPDTRRAWFEQFGIRILEGYGTTETAPALAVNTAMHFKARHGRAASSWHRTSTRARRGHRRGRETLRARPQRHARLSPRQRILACSIRLHEGWYDTGDIVDVDADGFVSIKGRVKRFAKVAGEMVPLGVVEDLVAKVWPQSTHAVVAIPDVKRGEQLVLVTDHDEHQREAFSSLPRVRPDSLEIYVPTLDCQSRVCPLTRFGEGRLCECWSVGVRTCACLLTRMCHDE